MDTVAFSMSNTEVTHLEWTYLLSLLREMQLVSIKQGCAFAGIVYINSHTLYYLKAESYALQAVASIEEPCTHMLLSCMIEVQPLEEVQCSSCLLFISTHIPRIIFFLTISHGTINHLSTIYDTILRAPKISLQTKARHPCFPLKKSTIKESMFWKACPIREFHFWFVSRPDTLYRYHQLWIKNAPLPFTRITFGLLSPEQVIKQTRQRLRFKLVHIRHFHSITNTHSKKKSAV